MSLVSNLKSESSTNLGSSIPQEPQFKNSITTQNRELLPNNTLKAYFMLAGFFSLFPFFVMIAEADLIDSLYPGLNYGFYVIIPTYVAIPLGFFGQKLINKLSMTAKFLFTIISMLILMNSILLVLFF